MKNVLNYLLILTTMNVSAQNLVPNPSFEVEIVCSHSIDSCQFWRNPTAYSPDYFNSCIDSDYSVPYNLYGYQNARTGIAYAGLILEFRGTVGSCREYIQCQLLDSLKTGKRYKVSFYTSISDSTSFAVNDIGAYLSDTAISSSVITYFPLQPQAHNNPVSNPLDQRDTWIQVVDTFIAIGGEKFITIGNFKDDANTDTNTVSGGSNTLYYSYYLIDDVSVILLDTLDSVNDIFFNENITYDDNTELIKTESRQRIKKITLYNINGNTIACYDVNTYKYNVSFNLKGLFFIRLEYENGSYCKKIITN